MNDNTMANLFAGIIVSIGFTAIVFASNPFGFLSNLGIVGFGLAVTWTHVLLGIRRGD